MQIVTRVAVVAALVLVLGAGAAGSAAAQPPPPVPPVAPPATTEPNPADELAQLACVQRYLDLTALPQQALQDPAAFSLLTAQAAQECDDVRAPAAPAPAPAG
ncbi:hypothetical protein ACLFMI_19035 [Pseudonocardia nantongensis]|uniref:hypothetical protein n=1 Tax=Pseudonocardia nantongensis TaxID=1181885 RepID=UPI00397B93F6